MSYSIDLKFEAHQDILEAMLWYDSRREGLGAEFYEEVEKSMSVLSEKADIFEIKYKRDVRWFKTARFPYILVYVIRKGTVVILAVVSTHRHPKIWQDRV